MLIPYTKPPLSFDEQLRLLKARGLYVPDQTLALRQLSSISYYRLSAYWYPFLKRDAEGQVIDKFKAEIARTARLNRSRHGFGSLF